MNLEGGTLEAWLKQKCESDPNEFPGLGKINYFVRYQGVADYLNANVHPHVVAGAMMRDGGYLTDHGPDHIATVIQRASQLVKAKECCLTPYEAYILLTAIHIHDVGNIFGRKKHETRFAEVMEHLGKLLGDDTPEQRLIYRIANAHGGDMDGNKDKIGHLQYREPILGKEVRTQLLAAILRFADELADESSRAARYLLTTEGIPKESEVYHTYARFLHSVIVDPDGGEIQLRFEFTITDATKQFGKGTDSVYLLDEIFGRTLKMHLERCYCSRFMRPDIVINVINVKIAICSKGFSEVEKEISYCLQEQGYPSQPDDGIYDLCPQFKSWNELGGEQLNGGSLASAFKSNASGK